MVSEVLYLGPKIDEQGLHPLADKVETVQAAPAPKNVSELKSYVLRIVVILWQILTKFIFCTGSPIQFDEIHS